MEDLKLDTSFYMSVSIPILPNPGGGGGKKPQSPPALKSIVQGQQVSGQRRFNIACGRAVAINDYSIWIQTALQAALIWG